MRITKLLTGAVLTLLAVGFFDRCASAQPVAGQKTDSTKETKKNPDALVAAEFSMNRMLGDDAVGVEAIERVRRDVSHLLSKSKPNTVINPPAREDFDNLVKDLIANVSLVGCPDDFREAFEESILAFQKVGDHRISEGGLNLLLNAIRPDNLFNATSVLHDDSKNVTSLRRAASKLELITKRYIDKRQGVINELRDDGPLHLFMTPAPDTVSYVVTDPRSQKSDIHVLHRHIAIQKGVVDGFPIKHIYLPADVPADKVVVLRQSEVTLYDDVAEAVEKTYPGEPKLLRLARLRFLGSHRHKAEIKRLIAKHHGASDVSLQDEKELLYRFPWPGSVAIAMRQADGKLRSSEGRSHWSYSLVSEEWPPKKIYASVDVPKGQAALMMPNGLIWMDDPFQQKSGAHIEDVPTKSQRVVPSRK